MRRRLHPVALLAGIAAAILQLAGALKTAPPLAALPVDLTLAAAAALLPCLAMLAATRRWFIAPQLAVPLAAALALPLWFVIAACWSASRQIAAQKLPEVVLVAPVMLMAGLLVGADPVARRALSGTTLLVGLALAGIVGWGVLGGWALRQAMDPEQAKLQYQLAGLGMAMAAGIAAVRMAEAGLGPRGLAWLAVCAALATAALVPGGRAGLVSLGLGVLLAPVLRLWPAGRGAALAWFGAGLTGALLAIGFLVLDPDRAEGLRTLERLTSDIGSLDARIGLWFAALDWAGATAPFGLGTGGFAIAAGHGERRGLYPHNHALEALAEGGLPGFLLWLAAFGGALAVALRLVPRVAPQRAARVAAMVLPVALTVMVSTDLGNRMAWFALGLALSLGITAHEAAPAGETSDV